MLASPEFNLDRDMVLFARIVIGSKPTADLLEWSDGLCRRLPFNGWSQQPCLQRLVQPANSLVAKHLEFTGHPVLAALAVCLQNDTGV